jgi:ribonuclease P protein component
VPTRERHRFPRSVRLRRGTEIRAALRTGRRVRTRYFDLYVAPAPAGCLRVALVVPRHGRSIVARNRVKRRLREAVRLEFLPRCRGRLASDIVVRARPEAYDAPLAALAAEFVRCARRLCSERSSSG